MAITLKFVAEQILGHGPDRVVISAEGEAVNSYLARKLHGVNPDIIFIRDDGWTLGAPKHLERVAFEMWWDHWIGFMRKPDATAIPISEYSASAPLIT